MKKRIVASLLAITILLIPFLGGCSASSSSNTPEETTEIPSKNTTITIPTDTIVTEPTTEATEPLTEVVSPDLPDNATDIFTQKQLNSVAMLNYLAIIAEEIYVSKDNRLLLEDIYTSLLNNTNPDKIDEITQDHLNNLLDIIKEYRMIALKRDRLQFVYNQDKANAIKSAVPEPLAIMSVFKSSNWIQLVASIAYTAVDSYNNYKSDADNADYEFLLNGWELDDEESKSIQVNRERAFNYMIDIVREYDLSGDLTLSENAVKEFAQKCTTDNVYLKMQFLESEEDTYKMLGLYWLELADCYYEIAEYQKCLDCVERYNQLATGIFRKDHNYVDILPKAIVAAQQVYKGNEYIQRIQAFADDLINNTDHNEWSLRYFAAQVYLDLYTKTDNIEYLQRAYDIALDNVSRLVDEQQKLNDTYLADVQEVELEEADERFLTDDEKKELKKQQKEEQKRLKAYNKMLKETRKTELPPLYEPLILNCDLLFALAEQLDIDHSEQNKIQKILETDDNGVFVSDTINERYSFDWHSDAYTIDYNKNKIIIPAKLLAQGATVTVTVKDGTGNQTFDDWMIAKVTRENNDIETFYAHLSSNAIKSFEWSVGAEITIEISIGENYEPLVFRYEVTEYKDSFLIPDKLTFEAV